MEETTLKKLLLAATFAFGATTAIQATTTPTIEASAKSYAMSNAFAKDLRNGTMPRAKGKVGMKFTTLSKYYPNKKFTRSDTLYHYHANDEDTYVFFANGGGFKKSQKTVMIYRTYDYVISKSSLQKHFGKPVLAKNMFGEPEKYHHIYDIYKAGKYYVEISTWKGRSTISVGTKYGFEDDHLIIIK